MKKKVKKCFNFLCMFIVLGTQTLLHGSWSHEPPNRKAA
ncbi:hypothetical protein I600_2497 [Maribacter dokdonensis DSW-8]|nr:hypothetical protein I600_2497 [Maribacter dokdonensis DSW-8]